MKLFYYARKPHTFKLGMNASRTLRSFSVVGFWLRRISRDTMAFMQLSASLLIFLTAAPLISADALFIPKSDKKNSIERVIGNILVVPAFINCVKSFFTDSHKTPNSSWTLHDYHKYFKKQLGDYKNDWAKQRQILGHHEWYRNPDFCEFILSLSETQAYLDEFREHSGFPLTHVDARRFDSAFASLYQFIDRFDAHKNKEVRPYVAHYSMSDARIIQNHNAVAISNDLEKTMAAQKIEITQFVQTYASTEPFASPERNKKRSDTMQLIEQRKETYSTKQYTVSPQAQQLLEQHAIDSKQYNQLFGNELQHVLHTECITVIEKTTKVMSNPFHVRMPTAVFDCIVDSAHTSFEWNKIGFVIHSIDFIEIAWTLLDYVQAVGEGIVEGAQDTIQTLAHPIDAAKDAVVNLYSVARIIAKVIAVHGEVVARELIPGLQNQERTLELTEKVGRVVDALDRTVKETPPREIIKGIAASCTSTAIFNKGLKAISRLFKYAQTQLPQYLEAMQNNQTVAATLLPEYIPASIAAQTAENLFYVTEQLNNEQGVAGTVNNNRMATLVDTAYVHRLSTVEKAEALKPLTNTLLQRAIQIEEEFTKTTASLPRTIELVREALVLRVARLEIQYGMGNVKEALSLFNTTDQPLMKNVRTLNHLEYVSKWLQEINSDPRWKTFKLDIAKGTSKGIIEEAHAAIACEKQGFLKNLYRSSYESADFFEHTGFAKREWDAKIPYSYSLDGKYVFNAEKFVAKAQQALIDNPQEHLIVDVLFLSDTEIVQLQNLITAHIKSNVLPRILIIDSEQPIRTIGYLNK